MTLIILDAAFYLYQQGQPVFGAVLRALATGFAIIFGANRFYGTQFIFPGGDGGPDLYRLSGGQYGLTGLHQLLVLQPVDI